MRDISSKQITLRTARAVGIIFCSASSIELIKGNALPKGNLFDVARAAGFLGAKLTPQLLPHCHPVTIDAMDFTFEFLDTDLHLEFFGPEILERAGSISPVLFLDPASMSRALYVALGMVDAVSIWILALLIVGYGFVLRDRVSSALRIFAVVGVYCVWSAIYVAIRVTLA